MKYASRLVVLLVVGMIFSGSLLAAEKKWSKDNREAKRDKASGTVDTDSKLVKKDGTVLSPVPAGTKLEEGDRLVTGSKEIKVVANGVEVDVAPGSKIDVTKKTAEGAKPTVILSVTEGKVTSQTIARAEGPVFVVTPSGNREVIVDTAVKVETTSQNSQTSGGRSPASVGVHLNAPSAAPFIAPPPPPPVQVITEITPIVTNPVISGIPVPTNPSQNLAPVPVLQPIERPMSASNPPMAPVIGKTPLTVKVGIQ